MKTTILAAFLSLLLHESALARNPCETKQAEISKKIEVAKKHGNKSQIDGLNKALKESKENCTPEGLVYKKNEKIKKLKANIKEREGELEKAKATGKNMKILKAEKKLQEAKNKLDSVESNARSN